MSAVEEGDGLATYPPPPNKKAKTEYPFCHFIPLDEYHVSEKSGKPTQKLRMCRHCVAARDAEKNKLKSLGLSGVALEAALIQKGYNLEKMKIKSRKDLLKAHLEGQRKRCQHYARWKAQQEGIHAAHNHQRQFNGVTEAVDIGITSQAITFMQPTSPGSDASSITMGHELPVPPKAVARRPKKAVPKGGAGTYSSTAVPKIDSLFLLSSMTEQERKDMEAKAIEMVVNCRLPESYFENQAVRAFLESIRPGITSFLPERTMVGGTLLNQRALTAEERLKKLILAEYMKGYKAGVSIHGWTKMGRNHIDEVIIRAGSAALPISTKQDGVEQHALAVAKVWERIIFSDFKDEFTFFFLCSVDAGQYGRARRILSARHPYILWLTCWARQVNLIVKRLLKSEKFKDTTKKAAASAKAINVSNEQYQSMLRKECNGMYGAKKINIMTIGETKWNSAQACMASLLRIQDACDAFSNRNKNVATFPEALSCWRDPSFWNELAEAEFLIRPFCEASYLLQKPNATMADVVHMLLYLTRHLHDVVGDSVQLARDLMEDIEQRWKSVENPLYFLAFTLHPAYRDLAKTILDRSTQRSGTWQNTRNPLTLTRLLKAAGFYFGKFELFQNQQIGSHHLKIHSELKVRAVSRDYELSRLRADISQWMAGKLDRMMVQSYQNGQDVVEWWDENSVEFPEISRFAKHLLRAAVQSADCEQLFKDFALFRTGRRNKLESEKMHKYALVQRDMDAPTVKKRKRFQSRLSDKKKSTNRIVEVDHYQRVDIDPAAAEASNLQGEGSGEGKANAVTTDENILFEDDLLDDERALESWISALEDVVEDEDDDRLFRNPSGSGEPSVSYDDSDDESPYETRWDTLPPLPDDNDKNYPQENERYFRTKKYVRNDKYSLLGDMVGTLHPERLEVPMLSNAFR